MTEDIIEEQIVRFCNMMHNLNRVYEDYARSIDIPYTTLEILDYITLTDDCTQKKLCEMTFLPKQTVNNVITAFNKQGLIELREVERDRRIKTIHLTPAGIEYADRYIPQIRKAEYEAMAQLTETQRKHLLDGLDAYCKIFRGVMPSGERQE